MEDKWGLSNRLEIMPMVAIGLVDYHHHHKIHLDMIQEDKVVQKKLDKQANLVAAE